MRKKRNISGQQQHSIQYNKHCISTKGIRNDAKGTQQIEQIILANGILVFLMSPNKDIYL